VKAYFMLGPKGILPLEKVYELEHRGIEFLVHKKDRGWSWYVTEPITGLSFGIIDDTKKEAESKARAVINCEIDHLPLTITNIYFNNRLTIDLFNEVNNPKETK